MRRPSTYLVLLECTWDDVPCGVFTDRTQALDFAKSLKVDRTWQSMGQLLGRDLTEPLCVSIVRFNASGHPKGHTIIRDLEQESDQ